MMEGHVFKNWAQTHSCRPELYFEPHNEQQLRQILAKARLNKKTVKVIGTGHSPSNIACTHGYMVSLKHFNQLIHVNAERQTVTVQAGMLLTELNQRLYEHDLALSVLGSVSDVSVAGVICTGTHGTGKTFNALQSYVLELWLMRSDGHVIKLSRDQADDYELFHASTLSLGALGVITSVTLQCERAFNLQQVHYSVPLTDIVENIDVHLSASEHFRFMWYPHTDHCIAYHCNRTTQKVRRHDSWFWDYFIGYIVLEFLYWLSTLIPRLVPYINRVYQRLSGVRRVTVDRSDRVFNFNCLFRQYVMEWAVPLDEMGVVLWRLKAWTDNNFFAHFPVEVRFVKRDSDTLLSLSRDTDVCFINIIVYRPYGKDVQHGDYWSAFQQIMLDSGGRPHWAKDFHLTPDQMHRIHPGFARFVEIRNRLDPDRMFTNDRLKCILGD